MIDGQPSLATILDGVKKGNRIAQKQLYEGYYSYAKNLCRHYSNSEEEAVEILNDSFLNVFRHIEMFDDSYAFKTWLRKIIIHKSIDYFRKYHKVKIVDLDPADPVFFNEEDYQVLDTIDDLVPALRKLSPMYRMVLNLHILEDLSHEEIAQKLNITAGTSRSNLFRAIENLRKIMNAPVPNIAKTIK